MKSQSQDEKIKVGVKSLVEEKEQYESLNGEVFLNYRTKKGV